VYTAPNRDDRLRVDYDQAGRLTPDQLTALLGDTYRLNPFGRDIELPAQAGLFYICGPPGFEQAVRNALLVWGAEAASIHSEQFTPTGTSDIASTPSTCTVLFKRSGRLANWTQDDDLTLLELAEANGLDPPSSCRAGSCHTCETAVLAGRVTYGREPPVPPAPRRALICCARPCSDSVELDL
jgi:ferredoxin